MRIMPPASVSKPLGLLTTAPPRPRPRTGSSASPREISFVRSSLRALGRSPSGCTHCHRTPLIGESVFFYGERMVCELCRPLRREAPGRQDIMHSPEHAHSVRLLDSR
jgi:hypothetical protein